MKQSSTRIRKPSNIPTEPFIIFYKVEEIKGEKKNITGSFMVKPSRETELYQFIEFTTIGDNEPYTQQDCLKDIQTLFGEYLIACNSIMSAGSWNYEVTYQIICKTPPICNIMDHIAMLKRRYSDETKKSHHSEL